MTMTMFRRCAAIGLLSVACGQNGIVVETEWVVPTVPMTDQIDLAMQGLWGVSRSLSPEDSARVESDLHKLKAGLSQLKHFYVPILQCQVLAQNALVIAKAGRTGDARKKIEKIRSLLEGVALSSEDEFEGDVEGLIDHVFHAEEAAKLRPTEMIGRIEVLVNRLLQAPTPRGWLVFDPNRDRSLPEAVDATP